MRLSRLLPLLASVAMLADAAPALASPPASAYIVVVEPGALTCRAAVGAVTATYGLKTHHSYKNALCGFATQLKPEEVTTIARDPLVAFVQLDSHFSGRV